MLKIYQAISFQGIITGGKTSPWLVLVNADGAIKPYIVKLFEQELYYEGDALARELIGNLLAARFGLPVPQCAMIDISGNGFSSSILNKKAQKRYDGLKIKIALGTEYLYPNFCFFPDVLRCRPISEKLDMAAVFAFDIMIKNRDRNARRPNLLIYDNLVYLIDFEASFQLNTDSLEEVLLKIQTHSYYYMHVFYSPLHGLDPNKKSMVFNGFIQKLGSNDFSFLDAYIRQLESIGFVIRHYQQINAYLEGIRQNKNQFANALTSLLYE